MKKISSILILVSLFIGIVSNNRAWANENNEKVENILIDYFSNELEEKKRLEVLKNDYIVPNSKLSQYEDIYSNLIVDWYKGINVGIEEYSIDVKINFIEYNGEIIKVDADKSVDLKYVGMDEYSKYTDNHIIYLRKVDGKLFVDKDITEKGLKASEIEENLKKEKSIENYDKYIDEKIKILKNKKNTLKEDINNFNTLFINNYNNKDIEPYGYSGYNGTVAAAWARKKCKCRTRI